MTALGDYLIKNGISQTEFARLAGMPAAHISMLASGERRAGLDTAFKIEQATNGAVPASYWRTLPPAGRKPKRVKKTA